MLVGYKFSVHNSTSLLVSYLANVPNLFYDQMKNNRYQALAPNSIVFVLINRVWSLLENALHLYSFSSA